MLSGLKLISRTCFNKFVCMRMPLVSDIVLFVLYGNVCVGLAAHGVGETRFFFITREVSSCFGEFHFIK